MLEVIQLFDFWFSHLIQGIGTPLLTIVMQALSFLGHPLFWMLIIAAVYWQGRERKALFLAIIALFSISLVGIMKPFFGRQRPSDKIFKRLVQDFYSPFSFPSGHATVIAAYWAYFAKSTKAKTAAFFAIVLLVAFSRVYLGVHFLSDIVAGIIIGAGIGRVVVYLEKETGLMRFRPKKKREGAAIIAIVLALVLAMHFLESLPLAAAIIGFFGGAFLLKNNGFDSQLLTGKKLLAKEAVGFAVMGLVLLASPLVANTNLPMGLGSIGETRIFITYAFIGLWIGCIWPLLYQKLLKKLQPQTK